ncbi:peroxisomal catalase A [Verticillium nonalfalfae]|uniref:Catalase n=1 Tax=Verticillium nonalfalfae TaxID=1051616 RepID=A0A3M9Y9Z9_9PEZI|nr:peroxisomal catalase A [Verticillium nonalfalfae]RNJ56358.1 peroxisomal catalase A [Verticillium nonalfalfae]
MADDSSNNKTPPTSLYDEKPVYTTSNGAPVANPTAFQRVGQMGPLLLQDFHLIDLLAHFDRERIPERVVHAKGAGAYGFFEVTDDISDICSVDAFTGVGKKTPLVTRFSTVGGEKGSADTARDPRGFAVKLYTQEGNLDLVMNNTPIFFLRDPTNFPLFIHTQKRNPQTNLKDATMFWDYIANHQECVHQVMHLFSDRGTPYSYRHMNGYTGHTLKWTKPDGSFVYTQLHFKTRQGNKTFTAAEAARMAAENPDWTTQDLFEAIARRDPPSWDVYAQTLTPAQAQAFRWNVFDLTKVWPQAEVPLRRFGRMTLDRNPANYFAEIEQAAFSPSHLVPGVAPSADPVLQARLFSYPDTHRHRLGVNYQQIPVNRPLRAFNPFQRDGAMAVDGNCGATPGYEATARPLAYKPVRAVSGHERWEGEAVEAVFAEVGPEDYVQAAGLWAVLGRTQGQQENYVGNVAGHLAGAEEGTRRRVYEMFGKVDGELGRRIEAATEKLATPVAEVKSKL